MARAPTPDIICIQANTVCYQSFHDTSEANGVQPGSESGDRALAYIAANGLGVMVGKGASCLLSRVRRHCQRPRRTGSVYLALAQHAVDRVH